MFFFKFKKEKALEEETKRCLEESDESLKRAQRHLDDGDNRSLTEKVRDFARR
jgi:hypothetical protein